MNKAELDHLESLFAPSREADKGIVFKPHTGGWVKGARKGHSWTRDELKEMRVCLEVME